MSDATITLGAAIGPNDELITVSAAGTAHTAPFIGIIDSEAILFFEGTAGTAWRARRGANDTPKSGHSNGATITIVSQPALDRGGSDATVNALGAGNLARSTASPAAAGTNQASATALTADQNYVTAADDTKGVLLPTAVAGDRITVINSVTNKILKVYPATGAAIDSIAANSALSVLPGETMDFIATSATQWRTPGQLRVARGVHTQAAASDTVATGLRTVVAVVAQFASLPTAKQLLCAATIGDQAGSPAAGSILTKTLKPTAVNDVTPTAATDFTDNLGIAWIAVGF